MNLVLSFVTNKMECTVSCAKPPHPKGRPSGGEWIAVQSE